MSEDNDKDRQQLRKLGLLSVIVVDLLGYTGAGIALGWVAYAKWGAPWWCLLLGSSAGLTVSMVRLYQYTKKDL